MRKIIFSIIIFIFLFISPSNVLAQISSLPKPITGTFLFSDFQITDTNIFNNYLEEIQAAGINTLIITTTGSVYKSPDCNGTLIRENYFGENRSNILENPKKLFQAAYDKGFSVYVGLSGYWQCISPTDQKIIDHSKTLAQNFLDLCQNSGWDCQSDKFFKGYYITEEFSLKQFGDAASFYQNMYAAIKTLSPSKKILISPYTNNTYEPEDYQTAYNAGYIATRDTYADIIALQDSVGSGKVTNFASDRDHFRGLFDGIKAAKNQLGKSIDLWVNIETFLTCLDCTPYPPTNFKTLSWQIRAAEGYVSNYITWTYSWSFASLPYLNSIGNAQYTQDFAAKRKILRNEYLTKPIITSAFPWYTPANMVIIGYNFGNPGDKAGVYIHYGSQTKQFISNNLIYDIGKPYREIRIPINQLPGFSWNEPFRLAVQNKEKGVSYFNSINPESPDPIFSEIKPFSFNMDDYNSLINSGHINIFDFNRLISNFGK